MQAQNEMPFSKVAEEDSAMVEDASITWALPFAGQKPRYSACTEGMKTAG